MNTVRCMKIFDAELNARVTEFNVCRLYLASETNDLFKYFFKFFFLSTHRKMLLPMITGQGQFQQQGTS